MMSLALLLAFTLDASPRPEGAAAEAAVPAFGGHGLVSRASQATPADEPFAYGNVLLRVPEGWKVDPKDEGLFLRPSDLKKDESYVVIIPPGTKADVNLAAGFEKTWSQVAGARKIAKKAPEKEIKTEGGVDGLMSVGLMDDDDGTRLVAAVALFKAGDRFQAVLALSEDRVFPRYSEAYGALIKGLRFRNVELPGYDLLISMGYTEKEGKTTVYVLFRDGTCLTLLPRDGLDLLEPAVAKKRHGDSAGTHETKDGVLTVRAGSRTDTLRPLQEGWHRSAETGVFQRIATSTGKRFDGRYVLHGGTEALVLKSDGTFAEEGKSGTYEIYNNTLYVSAADKSVKRLAFLAMPGPNPEFIYIGSAWYRRE